MEPTRSVELRSEVLLFDQCPPELWRGRDRSDSSLSPILPGRACMCVRTYVWTHHVKSLPKIEGLPVSGTVVAYVRSLTVSR